MQSGRQCTAESGNLQWQHLAQKLLPESVEMTTQPKGSLIVALLATTCDCKFGTAMIKALGKDKWKEYVQSEFLEAAKEILTKEEEPPIVYEAASDKTLDENQVDWEQQATNLIKQL